MKGLMKKTIPIVLLLGVSCIKKPTPPRWDVDLVLPLADTTFYLSDIVDSQYFYCGDSAILFHYSLDSFLIRVDSIMRLPGWDTLVTENIGSFMLMERRSSSTGISLLDVLPPDLRDSLNLNDSVCVPVPPISYSEFSLEDSIKDIRVAHIEEGVFQLNISNQFAIPVDQLVIDVLTTNGEDTVELFSVETSLLPDQSTKVNEVVENVNFYGHVLIRMGMSSPGSQEPVWLHNDDSLSLSIVADSLVVDSCDAYIPPVSFTDTVRFSINSNLGSLESVIFKNGNIEFNIENFTGVTSSIHLIFPALSFDTSLTVQGAGSNNPGVRSITVPLSSRELILDNGEAEIILSLNLEPGWTVLTSEDSVRCWISVDSSALSYVQGIVESTTFEIPTIDTSFDLPLALKNINFRHFLIVPTIVNSINFPVYGTIFLELTNGNQVVRDSFNIFVPRGNHGSPIVWDTTIDLSNFLNILPSGITAHGYFSIEGEGSLYRDDSLKMNVELEVPMEVKLRPDTITGNKTIDSTDVEEKGVSNILNGTIYINGRNGFPFGVSGKLFVRSLALQDTLVKAFSIPSPQISQEGWVIKDTTFLIELNLTNEEMNLLKSRPRESWVELILPGTGDRYVRLRPGDHLSINAIVRIKYHIEE